MQKLLATPNMHDESTENFRDNEYKYTTNDFESLIAAYKGRKPNEYQDLTVLRDKFGGRWDLKVQMWKQW